MAFRDWFRPGIEHRESGGDFSDAVIRLLEDRATGKAADSGSTAAVEAASGALSRAFASATVKGGRGAVTPIVLGQIGRDLVRSGQSLHVIQVRAGRALLVPASSWTWEGSHDPASWRVRATAYGPSTSTTWNLPASGVVFVRWGSTPGQAYIGTGPTSWAGTTARLGAEAERALADESAGPISNLLAVPQDGGDGTDSDPLASLKADIRGARGRAVLVETTAGGWAEGKPAAPKHDWQPHRLGPGYTEAQVRAARDGFERTLAACGVPPSLFLDSDGTSQREAVRRWHLGTVLPLARILETELSEKLEEAVGLTFDQYPLDLAGRAQAFQKLTAGGMEIGKALAISGLLVPE